MELDDVKAMKHSLKASSFAGWDGGLRFGAVAIHPIESKREETMGVKIKMGEKMEGSMKIACVTKWSILLVDFDRTKKKNLVYQRVMEEGERCMDEKTDLGIESKIGRMDGRKLRE